MSSMHRVLEGDVLVRHLPDDASMIDPVLLTRHGRAARTLVKDGPLRLTIMAIAPGGELPTHRTDGPVTIHVLDGDIRVVAGDEAHALRAGDVLVLAPGVPHSAGSTAGGRFLLTVVHEPSAGSRRAIP